MLKSGPHTSGSVPFLKMHGLGNDFVVIDARGGVDPVAPALARALGDRHFGVGFDQLAVIRDDQEASAAVDFWNSDGSTAGACGNATRCVAQLLFEEGATEAVLRTERGLLACAPAGDGLVRVDMGAPSLDWREVPLSREQDTAALDAIQPLEGRAPAAAGMGNPHCVFFVDDAEVAPVETLGPEIEHHPLYPERTNVEFVEVIDRRSIRLRVWERGAGVTLACGSGACAAVVAGVRRGLLDEEVEVRLDGGNLTVSWDGAGGVKMTGPTARVFSGALDPEFLATVGADE